jgi:hypothetical protein
MPKLDQGVCEAGSFHAALEGKLPRQRTSKICRKCPEGDMDDRRRNAGSVAWAAATAGNLD